MYLLFRYKNIFPSDYYLRKAGEKLIIRAFLEKELEEKQEEIRALQKAGEY